MVRSIEFCNYIFNAYEFVFKEEIPDQLQGPRQCFIAIKWLRIEVIYDIKNIHFLRIFITYKYLTYVNQHSLHYYFFITPINCLEIFNESIINYL